MNIQNIIVLLLTLAIGLSGTFYNEMLKEGIKKFFSNLNNKEVTVVFVGLLLMAISLPSLIVPKISEHINEKNQATQSFIINPPRKTDMESGIEASALAINETKQLVANKHRKDSIRLASKEQIWVYQIGSPKRDDDAVWDEYEKLKGIPNISIFKESRKNYFLIKDDGYTEKQLNDSLPSFRKFIASTGVENRIQIINLNSYCSLRKNIIQGKNIRKRKKGEIKCYICD